MSLSSCGTAGSSLEYRAYRFIPRWNLSQLALGSSVILCWMRVMLERATAASLYSFMCLESHKREQGARKRKCQKLSPNHCPLSNCFRGRDFILEQSRECCRLLFSAPELCSITGFISLFLTFLNVIVNLYHHFDMFFYEHHIFLISKRITPRIPFFLKKALVKSVFSADGDTEAAAPSQSLSLFD